jgi:hypothetical protein
MAFIPCQHAEYALLSAEYDIKNMSYCLHFHLPRSQPNYSVVTRNQQDISLGLYVPRGPPREARAHLRLFLDHRTQITSIYPSSSSSSETP